MAHSSWAPGWSNCQTGEIIGDFEVDGTRFPGGLRAELGELATLLVHECKARGYVFGVQGDPSYGCWGFSCRAIAGTSTPSNHSYGTAIDINAPSNPQRYPLTTDMPTWMVDLWAHFGWRWGGDYQSSTPDPMHFEYMGSVDDAAHDTARAHDAAVGEGGTDVPAGAQMMAMTESGGGYWVVDSTGAIFTYGDAQYYGGANGARLNAPIVAIIPTKTGGGYWLLGQDGGIFTFGDAAYHGAPTGHVH